MHDHSTRLSSQLHEFIRHFVNPQMEIYERLHADKDTRWVCARPSPLLRSLCPKVFNEDKVCVYRFGSVGRGWSRPAPTRLVNRVTWKTLNSCRLITQNVFVHKYEILYSRNSYVIWFDPRCVKRVCIVFMRDSFSSIQVVKLRRLTWRILT